MTRDLILYCYSLFALFFFSVICISYGFLMAIEQTGLLIVGMVVLLDIYRMIVETWFRGE
nr:MAG TPA: hypothetical protein [Caudoviricetes sp.]